MEHRGGGPEDIAPLCRTHHREPEGHHKARTVTPMTRTLLTRAAALHREARASAWREVACYLDHAIECLGAIAESGEPGDASQAAAISKDVRTARDRVLDRIPQDREAAAEVAVDSDDGEAA